MDTKDWRPVQKFIGALYNNNVDHHKFNSFLETINLLTQTSFVICGDNIL